MMKRCSATLVPQTTCVRSMMKDPEMSLVMSTIDVPGHHYVELAFGGVPTQRIERRPSTAPLSAIPNTRFQSSGAFMYSWQVKSDAADGPKGFHLEYGRSPLLADRAHNARGGAGVTAPRTLHLLQDRLVVGGSRRHSKLRLHEDDLVAAGLEIIEQVHRGLGGGMLEIVDQHDAFAMLLQFFHHRLADLFGLAHLEIERIHVG